MEKALKWFQGTDIEQLLVHKRSDAAEPEQVVRADIACCGPSTHQAIAIALGRSNISRRGGRRLGRYCGANRRLIELMQQARSASVGQVVRIAPAADGEPDRIAA